MKNKDLKWEIINKSSKSTKGIKSIKGVVDILLKNRGVRTKKQKEEFFNPPHPGKLSIKELGIDADMVKKAIKRIKKAVKDNEEIVIYGDYDADGICATAIIWEVLYSLTKKVKPYIPDRFEEGYGLNADSIQKLKIENEKLKIIITVDNGIVANDAVDKANELGIDVIITDHHQPHKALTSSRGLHPRAGGASLRGKKKYEFPDAHAIVHTTKISGAGISWILARELLKGFLSSISNRQSNSKLKINKLEKSMEIGKLQPKVDRSLDEKLEINKGLDLCAIGTIADQMPLLGANRSFAKFGLVALNKTIRPGLLALFEEAAIKRGNIKTYEVNFIIAPRLNAMGRLEHAIDSLRLLCTKSFLKARELAYYLGKTNKHRQKIVDEVVAHAHEEAKKRKWKGVILLSHGSYNEGVIGLAASKLVEEFWRPAIVLSEGRKISKASARSISGFNIIESIRKLDGLILGGGGHPMAAGFSIETDKVKTFKEKFDDLTAPLLTNDVLKRKIKIDMEIGFANISETLIKELERFEPSGNGNPMPLFVTKNIKFVSARTVGADGKHLKLALEGSGFVYNAIAFAMGEYYLKLKPGSKLDIVYSLVQNTWNNKSDLQLKIKDLKIRNETTGV